MRIIVTISLILISLFAYSQTKTDSTHPAQPEKPGIGIGIKGGLNFMNVSDISSINGSNETGFMVGIFLAPPTKSIISFTTELDFSQQGYNFKTSTTTGSVKLDYILLPQVIGINITKFVTIQLGFQMAFLINAKADSSGSSSSGNPYSQVLDYYNRFDYGAMGGIEVHPFKGILVGARYNVSFNEMYKMPASGSATPPPSFFPEVNFKNNVVQIFVGYRF